MAKNESSKYMSKKLICNNFYNFKSNLCFCIRFLKLKLITLMIYHKNYSYQRELIHDFDVYLIERLSDRRFNITDSNVWVISQEVYFRVLLNEK